MSADYEAEARAAKAAKLAATLYKRHASASMLERLSDEGWELAALIAGVNPPSDKTKALVIKLVDAFDEGRARGVEVSA